MVVTPTEVDDIPRSFVTDPVPVDSNGVEEDEDSTFKNTNGSAICHEEEQPASAAPPSSWFSFRKANKTTSTTATTNTNTVADPVAEDLDDTMNSIPEDLLRQVGDMEKEITESVSNIYDDTNNETTTTGGGGVVDNIDDDPMDNRKMSSFDDNRTAATAVVDPHRNSNKNSSAEWGMVSDNEDDNDDDVDGVNVDAIFNFVAVSESLLMEERSSFEQVVSSSKNQDDYLNNEGTTTNEVDNDDVDRINNDDHDDTCHGVLIVDGLIHDDDDEYSRHDDDTTWESARRTATGSDANIAGSSATLTIPGSDSLPSDLDTISHQGDNGDYFFGHDDGTMGAGADLSEHHHHHRTAASEGGGGHNNNEVRQPLVHRFLQNILLNNARCRHNLTEDYHGVDDDANNSILRVDDMSSISHRYDDNDNDNERNSEERRLLSVSSRLASSSFSSPSGRLSRHRGAGRRRVSVFKIVAIFVTTSFVVLMCRNVMHQHRRQEEEWKQRLLQEEEEKARLQAEKEALHLEMEQLQEEAAVAWARAESLAKEQERMRFLQEETEREAAAAHAAAAAAEQERRRKEQDDEKQQRRRENCRKRRRSSRNDHRDNDDFDWFFHNNNNMKENEDCDADDDGTSFTFADNCWLKAKADINFGECGSTTKDLFSDFWDGLWYSSWDDWDNYFDFGASSSDAVEPYKFASSSTNKSEEEEQKAKGGGERFNCIDDNNHQQQQPNLHSGQNQNDQDDDNSSDEHDPFTELFSVISSVGQSFATKFTSLISDETISGSTRKIVKDVDNIARRGYMDATKTVSDTVVAVKKDIRDVSQEARNDWNDVASSTLSSLSKAWEDTTSSFLFDMEEEDDIIPPTLQ